MAALKKTSKLGRSGRTAKPARLIGLTGSLASGKSTVLETFEHCGAAVISADDIVAEIYKEEGLTKERLTREYARFPKKLKALERWIHPLVKARILKWAKTPKVKKSELVVIEVPLLYEVRWESAFDKTITVFSPLKDRLMRVKHRGMAREVFNKLESRQLSPYEKVCKSDFVILNLGDRKVLRKRVKDLVKILQAK